MFKRIVVPLDGSKLAEVALDQAKELAKLFDAELVLLRVIDYADIGSMGDFELIYGFELMALAVEAERQAANEYLAKHSIELAAEGLKVTTQLVDGVASKVIVASAQDGDLIVMSTHGRSGLKRWILGSVAESVLRHATVPVLSVRSSDTQTAEAETSSQTS